MSEDNEFNDLPHPVAGMITVYSKNDCDWCQKTKDLLESNKLLFIEVKCDQFISTSSAKARFKAFLSHISDHPITTFPIIFDRKMSFIGGYKELEVFLSQK